MNQFPLIKTVEEFAALDMTKFSCSKSIKRVQLCETAGLIRTIANFKYDSELPDIKQQVLQYIDDVFYKHICINNNTPVIEPQVPPIIIENIRKENEMKRIRNEQIEVSRWSDNNQQFFVVYSTNSSTEISEIEDFEFETEYGIMENITRLAYGVSNGYYFVVGLMQMDEELEINQICRIFSRWIEQDNNRHIDIQSDRTLGRNKPGIFALQLKTIIDTMLSEGLASRLSDNHSIYLYEAEESDEEE